MARHPPPGRRDPRRHDDRRGVAAAPRPIPTTEPRRAPRSDDPARPRRNDAEASRWLYGRHAVAAALANPARRCRRIISLPEAQEWLSAAVSRAKARLPEGAEVAALPRAAFELLLPEGAVHQGVALLPDPLA